MVFHVLNYLKLKYPLEGLSGQMRPKITMFYIIRQKLTQTYSKWKVTFWAAVCLPKLKFINYEND